MNINSKFIFDHSKKGSHTTAHIENINFDISDIPKSALRKTPVLLPEVSELQVVRHFTTLSHKNFSIDTHSYPLGSCTMKYNPRGVHSIAMLENIITKHPLRHEKLSQGLLSILFELQEHLKNITGMSSVCLSPMAGAQGELAGVLMIRAYHLSRKDYERSEMLVPDAAHGTNPASAVMSGYTVKEIPTNKEGDIDLFALEKLIGPKTAGIMLTNPSTCGVFERKIKQIANMIHAVGGLLYYDGANLNAILGKVRPGDMGFDVMHMNLHKTFATPHGGGGPGAGPVAVSERLSPFLPIPRVIKMKNSYLLETKNMRSTAIGRLSTFMGNTNVLLRAYIYIRMLGKQGLERVAKYSVLNANYIMAAFKQANIPLAFPTRLATHEFIATFKTITDRTGVRALDIAKRLMDFGIHAPTIYFPLLVPECFLIEPTETESKENLDEFIEYMKKILLECESDNEKVLTAPHNLPIKRIDEVEAARRPCLRYQDI